MSWTKGSFKQLLQQHLPDGLARLAQRFAQGVQSQRMFGQLVEDAFGQYFVFATAGREQIEGGDAGPAAVGPATQRPRSGWRIPCPARKAGKPAPSR